MTIAAHHCSLLGRQQLVQDERSRRDDTQLPIEHKGYLSQNIIPIPWRNRQQLDWKGKSYDLNAIGYFVLVLVLVLGRNMYRKWVCQYRPSPFTAHLIVPQEHCYIHEQ